MMLSIKLSHAVHKCLASGIYPYPSHTFVKPVGGLATEMNLYFFQVSVMG